MVTWSYSQPYHPGHTRSSEVEQDLALLFLEWESTWCCKLPRPHGGALQCVHMLVPSLGKCRSGKASAVKLKPNPVQMA